jgi:hypothetical protein
MIDPSQDSWIRNFVAVQVQDRQHGSIGDTQFSAFVD